jgi:hypothetical protein
MALLDRLRDRAAHLPAVRLAVLFGSTARGLAGERSDIDLGVLLEPDVPSYRFEAEAELGRAAGREIDLIFLSEAPPLLRFEIARDGVLLCERQEGLWTEFQVRAMEDWWDWAPYHKLFTEAAIAGLREKLRDGQA